ncbi:MAG: P22 phage major capsid protein family protein [Verrucomicrobiota bacterium]
MATTNAIVSELQLTEVLDSALVAFRKAILPLSIFSQAYEDVELQGDGTINVPYYPLATDASQDMAASDSYLAKATDTNTLSKTVALDKHKVQAISFTAQQVAREPKFNPEMHGQLKAEKLASDITADVLSVVTAANFPSTTIAATIADNFDEVDVAELAKLAMEADWPNVGRGMVLNPAFYYALVGSPALLDASQSNDPAVLREALVQRILEFNTFGSNGVPTNGLEKLAGFVSFPSAILTAFAPVPPTKAQMSQVYDYRIVKDEYTGLVLEYKHLVYPDTSQEVQVIEAHYGFAIGEVGALKRIVTP